MTVVIVILLILAGAFLVGAVVVAVVKKVPPLTALAVCGLGMLSGILVAVTVVAKMFEGRKNAENYPTDMPADSGSASISTAFDERRNRLKATIERILQSAGSS